MRQRVLLVLFICQLFAISCIFASEDSVIVPGAYSLSDYLPLLEGKNLAIVANQTSVINGVHLVDTLFSLSENHFRIQTVFSPEHGFRGDADAGAKVEDQRDLTSGLKIYSLYGKNKKPTDEQMRGIDLVIFDIQDVGVRFYTYISTLHYMMEACAENDAELIVLDRPNPNGNYIDGPVLDLDYQSFVGMHPIPVVYGMTIAELALMINGERWLRDGQQCKLKIFPIKNYRHSMSYSLPVVPSPNLPNDHAVRLYPSLCFFEGTVISEGRGTYMPFEVFGHPALQGDFSFTPKAIKGMSMYPKFKNQLCYGTDLRGFYPEAGWNSLFLSWLLETYKDFGDKENFFIPFFDKLAGNSELRQMIIDGKSEDEIRLGWEVDLDKFLTVRKKYLLYSD